MAKWVVCSKSVDFEWQTSAPVDVCNGATLKNQNLWKAEHVAELLG